MSEYLGQSSFRFSYIYGNWSSGVRIFTATTVAQIKHSLFKVGLNPIKAKL